MRGSNDLPDTILLVVIGFLILALGIAAVNPVIEQTLESTGDGEQVKTSQEIQSAGTWYTLADTTGVEPTAYDSRGYAVNLTGANDSYVRADQGIDVSQDDTWTISLWARLDRDATSEKQTALSVNGRVIVTYNQTSADWVVWYYDDGSKDSYELSVSGPNQPANFTNIQVVSNETHLNLYHNNTLGDTANLSTSSIADAPVNSTNWNGRLEEVRTFDDSLDASTRQSVVDAPVEPRTGTNRTARVMFDEPYKSTQLILFSDAELEQSNVTFSSGFTGRTLSEGQYALTSEFNWNEDGPRIKLLEGGSAEDLPVVYVDYTQKAVGPSSLLDSFISAILLAALLPILVILGFIFTTLRETR